MSTHCGIYRSLLWLYPKEFRREYGDDLVQNFADLLAFNGARATWARTSVDLIITVPRYRLETIMSEQKSATTINIAIVILCTLAVLSLATGFYPLSAVLFIFALVFAFVQRGALARAIRTPGHNRRRNRLGIAAILAVVTAISLFSYFNDLNDDEISTLSLLVHNAIGNSAMIGAIVYLLVGLFTPRESVTSKAA